MHVDLVWLATVALSLPLLSECTPLNIMMAPNILRVGTPEAVFVEMQDYSGGDTVVKISVKNFPQKNRDIMTTSVTLTSADNYQKLVKILVPNLKDLFEDNIAEKQYVYLQAQFGGASIIEKVVMVSFRSGYIFIQTDKTIYTPGSTVHYRIFTLNPGLEPVASGVSVEIMTPDNIIIEREIIFPDQGVKSGNFKLPEITSPGIWKVVTRFKDTPQKNFSADFEVKEYVLPSFEVTLQPEKAFFYVNDDELIVDIRARYLFGKEVRGAAFVVFSVISDDEKITLPGSLQRVEISEGKGRATLTREHITQSVQDIHSLVGKSILISVSVLTDTGSEMVEARRKGIKIVTSPYTIQFKGTPKYYKPGMPFDVSVYVTNPDQTSAKDVEVVVSPGGVHGTTRGNGMLKLTVNSEGGSSKLDISVKTADSALTPERQASNQMTALPYITKGGSRNYLHIGVDTEELNIGEQLKVNLNLGESPGVKEQDFTYMVVSKGQIVSVMRFKRKGQALVTLSLPVTKDMVPSFRLVAYYHVGPSEVVSDAVWVDVTDSCMGTLKVEVTRPRETYSYGRPFHLRITGDPGAKVGLVAVDKGVYVLNNKNRLTQTKIWDVIEKHDTGCTAGSGKDSMGVFYDAGLLFESNTAGGTDSRNDPSCPVASKRRRRAKTILEVTTTLSSKYSGLEKQCCTDGMKENRMGFSCDRRSKVIVDGDACVKAFLYCCTEMSKQKQDAGDDQLILARSEEEDDFFDISDEITSRTQFPESWLWEDEMLPECPPNKQKCDTTEIVKSSFLKDSITTWEITAISLSKTLGICVADTLEMTVVKDFFIDLKLPYSAVRNEQLEIKAILHNYNEYKLLVRVELYDTEHVCSLASKKRRHRVTVKVEAMSTRSVPFVIIPMEIGTYSIEVKAYDRDGFNSDGVRRDLLVVSEGVLTKIEVKNEELNPSNHGGEQVVFIRSAIPKGQIPNSPSSTHITVTGEEISQTIEKAVNGDFMGSLIVQPTGCGEQTMIYMTLPLIATHYLDNTNQWEGVGVHRRAEAIGHINTGYQRELSYRKSDGSYAAWTSRPSSTWLTAYVAKVFAMANELINLDENVICSAIKWLILNKQLPDGMFREDAPVIHGEMVGGVRGKDADASLTAFVLIAMQEGSKICNDVINSLPGRRKLSADYLRRKFESLTSAYAVAMSAYALANEGDRPQDTLMKHAKVQGGDVYWQVPGGHHFTLEASAYALLALVKVKDFDEAGKVVLWLNRQRSHYGGHGTTQATIMVFQAVAEYRIQAKKIQDVDLQVDVQVSGRSKAVEWTFNKGNRHISRSDKVNKINQNITVTAKGKGVGAVSVLSLYYAKPVTKDSDCQKFDLTVELIKQPDTSFPDAIESYELTIRTFYKSDADSTMTILDVGLLTGFIVDNADLTALSTGRERYIQKFEMDKQLSERGSLILYLDKVSHSEADILKFKIHKINQVGFLQPAAVTVYEYYSPDEHCKKFYHPEKLDGALNRLCSGDVCRCAEENCSYQRKHKIDDRKEEDKKREETACEANMDFVYKVLVEGTSYSQDGDIYHMKIVQVVKEGTDAGVEGKVREFLAHPRCREALALGPQKSYLVMGSSSDLPVPARTTQYVFGEKTWVEYWPTDEEGQTLQYRNRFIGIQRLVHRLTNRGCGV